MVGQPRLRSFTVAVTASRIIEHGVFSRYLERALHSNLSRTDPQEGVSSGVVMNTKVLGRSLILFILCFPLAVPSALAQPNSITVYTSYPPLTTNGSNPGSAIHTEFVDIVLKQVGVEYELLRAPHARSYRFTQNTPNSLFFAVQRTPSREQDFHWIGRLSQNEAQYNLYKLKSRKDLLVSDFDSIRPYRIGVLRADAFREHFEYHGFEFVEPVNRRGDNLKKIAAGRIDFFASAAGNIESLCIRYEFDCELLEPVLKLEGVSSGAHLVANKDSDPEFIELLTKIFQEKFTDGTYTALLEKYSQ